MQQTTIENLLPEVIRRTLRPGEPLDALLYTMTQMLSPAEQVLEQLPESINPYTTPTRFLPMLAHWVNLDCIFPSPPAGERPAPWARQYLPIPESRLRDLIAAAARLSQWRGTAFGLSEFLQIATGLEGFEFHEHEQDEHGRALPFHLRIRAPAEARDHIPLIECIVRSEKPAYVTWELEFSDSPASHNNT